MTAMKELVIEMRVPLSGDMFGDAEKISALKRVAEVIKGEADVAFGAGDYTILASTKTRVPERGRKRVEKTTPSEGSGSYPIMDAQEQK